MKPEFRLPGLAAAAVLLAQTLVVARTAPAEVVILKNGLRLEGSVGQVAELGAAFLCGHCGIETATLENSSAYISSWLRTIRQDSRLVVQSAAAAQKAADWILGRSEGGAV